MIIDDVDGKKQHCRWGLQIVIVDEESDDEMKVKLFNHPWHYPLSSSKILIFFYFHIFVVIIDDVRINKLK